MKALSLFMIMSLLVLCACDVEREPPLPGPYGQIERELDSSRITD